MPFDYDGGPEFFKYRTPSELCSPDASLFPLTDSATAQLVIAQQQALNPDPRLKDMVPISPTSNRPTCSVSHGQQSAPDQASDDTKATMHLPIVPGASWACNKSGRIWCATRRPQGASGTNDTVVVYRETANGNMLFAPIFHAKSKDQSICRDDHRRRGVIERMTEDIITLNPSAYRRFQSEQLGAESEPGAEIDLLTVQDLNTLATHLKMTGIRFRQLPKGDGMTTGKYYMESAEVLPQPLIQYHNTRSSRATKLIKYMRFPGPINTSKTASTAGESRKRTRE